MAGLLDTLGGLGMGALKGWNLISAAGHGNLQNVLDASEQTQLRQQQAVLIRATAMADPNARAYLTQNPDIALKLFNLPSVAREEATPETLEAGGYAVPGGPTTGTPPARLGLVPPQVQTPKMLKERQQLQTQQTVGDIFKQLLGGVAGGGGQPVEGGAAPIAGGGAAPMMGGGGGTVNIGGAPMRPVPSISPSGGMGLSFQAAPPPIKVNAPTAKRLGLAKGGTYQGRSVVVTEPETTAQTRFKEEWASKVDTFAGEVEKALAGIGSYNGPQAWLRTGKVALSISDPQWQNFTKKADLLGSALMNVHVGAKGSEGMMQHFIDGVIGATHQSSGNVTASLKVVRGYLKLLAKGMNADDALMEAQMGGTSTPTTGGPPPSGSGDEGSSLDTLRARVRKLGGGG